LHRNEGSRLYCLNAENGELIWDFQTKSHVESSPTVVEGKLIFGAGGDGVYCLDAKTSKAIWHFSGIHVDLSPAVSEGKVLVGTGYDQTGVYCLDLETGALLWRHQTRYPVWGSPAINDGKAYFGLGNGNFIESDPNNPYGALLCLDLDSRQEQRERWKYEVKDAVLTSAAVAEGKVYFGSRDGSLYCVDAKSGRLIWQYETGVPILSSSAVAGEFVYFGAQQGKIYALNRTTGELKWEQDLSEIAATEIKLLASPAAAAGQIYIGGSKGMFFAIGKARDRST
jgi:outer membrane protein assembly factor BamB